MDQFVLITPVLQDLALRVDRGEVETLLNVLEVHHFLATLSDDEDVLELAIAFDGRPSQAE
jgi:hypothetical protein